MKFGSTASIDIGVKEASREKAYAPHRVRHVGFHSDGGAFAQTIADQLPLYVVGSFAKANYDSLPVLRNFFALESRMSDYKNVYKTLGLGIEAWDSGDWQGARDRLLDHAQEIGSLDRFSSMDGLILTSLYFAYIELRGKLGGAPLDSPRDKPLAYLAMGQANYYITFPQVAKSGPEDTRKALDYATAAIDEGQKLEASPGFYYYSALAHYLGSETYPKTHAYYFSNLNTASWEITMVPTRTRALFRQTIRSMCRGSAEVSRARARG